MRYNLPLVLLRRSPAAAAFPLLAAVAFYGCLRTQSLWLGNWAQTSLQIRNSLVFLAPAVAAVGAWAGNQEARHGMVQVQLIGVLPRWRQSAAAWTAAAVWTLTAYGCACALTLFTSLSKADWGAPSLSLLANGALAALAYLTLGFTLGSRWPSMLAVPLAAVLTYLLGLAALENWTSDWRQLVPYNDDVITDGSTFRQGVLYAQSLWLLGLVLLGLAVALRFGRKLRTPLGAGAAVLALALTTAGAASAVGQGDGFTRRAHITLADLTCAGAPRVCLHPSRASQLTVAERGVRTAVSTFQGVRGLPALYLQADVLAELPDESIAFPLGDRGINEYQVAMAVVDDLLMRSPCAALPMRQGGPTRGAVVETWFMRHSGIPAGEVPAQLSGEASEVDRMTPARRQSFLEAALNTAPTGCAWSADR